ncbi:MAG: rod-binding protein, partial [Chromatiales bacterium]|nr:rod-binding protein [Chromatiales bacterium]
MDRINASLYTDFSGLAELKAKAGDNPDETIDQVAKQFESLFMQQMLKSMRQASLGDGLLDNDQSLFYRDMYDQQLALHLSESGGGIGLADVIKRQLGGGETVSHPVKSLDDYRRMVVAMAQPQSDVEVSQKASPAKEPQDAAEAVTEPVDEIAAAETVRESFTPASPQEFIEKLWPWASEAASLLGIEPQALLAQAALESGWGKHVMKFANGDLANNLFGI